MRVWSVANQKGGVGKTTTAVSLGRGLAARGGRVLLVDLDPHGSLTAYFGHDPETVEPNVFLLFGEPGAGAGLAALGTGVDGLSLWPASPALATLDRRLGAAQGLGLVLRGALQRLGGRFDWVLVDCPPMLGVLMVNALGACERLLIPVQTEHLALQGLKRMVATLAMVQRSRGRPLPWLAIPTLYDGRTRASREALEQLRADHPGQVWPGLIPADTRFRDASQRGRAVQDHAPGCRGALAYQALLEFLLAGLGREAPPALHRAAS